MIHWKPKRFIDKWIDEMTLIGHEFIQPKVCFELIQKEYPVTEKEVWDYFFQLVIEGQLTAVAGISCSHSEGDSEVPSILYNKKASILDGNVLMDVRDILDQTLTCQVCHKKIFVDEKQIWMSFSPTEEYTQMLKEEKKQPFHDRLKLIQ